jgi:hypothetical protein
MDIIEKKEGEHFQEIFKKVEAMKTSGNLDLSTEEDLAMAVMNLISLEEHFYFTGAKTDKPEYFDMLIEVRGMRTKLLAKMIDPPERAGKKEGEVWCISKHLLATSMRLLEVGTKLQKGGKKDEAKEFFDDSYKMFNLFFALRLKLVSLPELQKMADEEKPMTLKDVMSKLVDCCKE